jgi:hypothetical protein
MGGVDYMFLSHRDDIADHQKFHDHFGCDRIFTAPKSLAALSDIEIKLPAPSRSNSIDWAKIY